MSLDLDNLQNHLVSYLEATTKIIAVGQWLWGMDPGWHGTLMKQLPTVTHALFICLGMNFTCYQASLVLFFQYLQVHPCNWFGIRKDGNLHMEEW